MAKMLTEEEVKEIEKQRALRDRARAAGSTAGMSWIEKERFNQQQLNDRFRQAHEQAMENRRARILANPNGETDTTLRHNVIRDAEMSAAREHEMERLGKELATREKEARERRMGMREQGRDAAEFNKEAAIRAAELQTASNERIAGINKERDVDVEKIKGSNALEVQKEQGDASIEAERIRGEATVDAAREKTAGELARERAEDLARRRYLKMGQAVRATSEEQRMAMQMVNASKRNGRATISYEEALERVRKNRREPGVEKPASSYE